MFDVLKPVYVASGIDRDGYAVFAVSWEKVGEATGMEDAKRRFGGYPVLERQGLRIPRP